MASKQAPKKIGISAQNASRWIGHPVFVVLNNGSYYVGMVRGIQNGRLIFAGTKGRGTINRSGRSEDQLQVSGLLQSMFGGGRAFNPAGAARGGQPAAGLGGGGFFGMITQMWPTISMGLQMVRTIMPLLSGFKF